LLSLVRIPGAPGEDGKPRWLSPFSWFYEHLCKKILPADPRVGSLVYALCFIMLMWFFAWLLDRKKVYIKV
jgi:predicted acyltransferase